MKKIKLIALSVLAVSIITSCDVDQTKEMKMPDVDVDIDTQAGQLPSFDVDWAEVDVSTRTETVTIPKVVVVTEEVEVEIPYVDVEMPGEGEKEEITVQVEAEIAGTMKELDIKEVYATGKRLIVISELREAGDDLGSERVRISDRMVLNARDLDVKHYIIGERPTGSFNTSYSYVKNRSALKDRLKNAKQIYKK